MRKIALPAALKEKIGAPQTLNNKYGAKRTQVGDIWFASKAEAARYSELLLLKKAGEITDLETQVPFWLHVNNLPIGKYVADFTYAHKATGEKIVEDVKGGSWKGSRTALYKWKKRHMLAEYDIDIVEISVSPK